MSKLYCCDSMKYYMELKCDQHKSDPHECPDYAIAKFGKDYGIPIRDGGSSYSKINYCPYCGTSLK